MSDFSVAQLHSCAGLRSQVESFRWLRLIKKAPARRRWLRSRRGSSSLFERNTIGFGLVALAGRRVWSFGRAGQLAFCYGARNRP